MATKKPQRPIKIKASNAGKLRATANAKKDQPIPQAKLQALANSKNPTTRKRAQFALNAKKWNHKGGGKGK